VYRPRNRALSKPIQVALLPARQESSTLHFVQILSKLIAVKRLTSCTNSFYSRITCKYSEAGIDTHTCTELSEPRVLDTKRSAEKLDSKPRLEWCCWLWEDLVLQKRLASKAGDTLSSRHVSSCDVNACSWDFFCIKSFQCFMPLQSSHSD